MSVWFGSVIGAVLHFEELVLLFQDRGRVAGPGVCQKHWALSGNYLSYRGVGVNFTVNASSLILLKLFKGLESLENKQRWVVDVRDVADAILMAYEKPEAEGRYLCTAHSIMTDDLVEKLRRIYPNFSYHKNFIEVDNCIKLSSEKLQKLRWRYRPLEETLVDSVESYKFAGLLESK